MVRNGLLFALVLSLVPAPSYAGPKDKVFGATLTCALVIAGFGVQQLWKGRVASRLGEETNRAYAREVSHELRTRLAGRSAVYFDQAAGHFGRASYLFLGSLAVMSVPATMAYRELRRLRRAVPLVIQDVLPGMEIRINGKAIVPTNDGVYGTLMSLDEPLVLEVLWQGKTLPLHPPQVQLVDFQGEKDAVAVISILDVLSD